MKILVVSDIHGSAADLEKVLALAKKMNIKDFIIVGDYLNHGPRNDIPKGYDTKKTAALLNQIKSNITSVRGNCDSEVDQMMLEFPVMSDYSQLFFANEITDSNKPNGKIFIHHGHLFTNDDLKKLLPKNTIIISGHTHIAIINNDDNYYFFNPGSISIPKNPDKTLGTIKTCGLIEIEENLIKKISICTLDGTEIQKLEW